MRLRAVVGMMGLVAACGGGEAGDAGRRPSRTSTSASVVEAPPVGEDSAGAAAQPRRHDLDGHPEALGGVGPFDYLRATSTETVEGRYGGELVVVRLAQVDAPAPGDCYHHEALEWLEDWGTRFGTGMAVRVPVGSAGFGERPVVAELVAVEAFEDTHDLGSLNVAMVRAGAGRRTAEPDASEGTAGDGLAERLREAEDDARASRRGIWDTCIR